MDQPIKMFQPQNAKDSPHHYKNCTTKISTAMETRYNSNRINEEEGERNDTADDKIKWLRSQIIGGNVEFDSPFGKRRLTYADHTASGRCLHYVENYIIKHVLPFYGEYLFQYYDDLNWICWIFDFGKAKPKFWSTRFNNGLYIYIYTRIFSYRFVCTDRTFNKSFLY